MSPKEKFVNDFVRAWTEIMDADRLDVQNRNRATPKTMLRMGRSETT